jgi:hypothetical protein
VTFKWTVAQQVLSDHPQYSGNGLTTTSKSATNIIQNYKWTYSTSKIGNVQILDLLENSLSQTFPAGTKLVTDGQTIYVTDSTGTNIIQNISSIVTVTSADKVTFGLDDTKVTIGKKGTTGTGNVTKSGAEVVTLNYNDSGTSKDGTTTAFTFVGESIYSVSGSSTESTNSTVSGKVSGNFVISGFGYGMIRGTNSNFEGTVAGFPAGSSANLDLFGN